MFYVSLSDCPADVDHCHRKLQLLQSFDHCSLYIIGRGWLHQATQRYISIEELNYSTAIFFPLSSFILTIFRAIVKICLAHIFLNSLICPFYIIERNCHVTLFRFVFNLLFLVKKLPRIQSYFNWIFSLVVYGSLIYQIVMQFSLRILFSPSFEIKSKIGKR